MDVSASFQFLVDAFRREWRVIAPDWRGFGLTAWNAADSYWFPDYFADLDRLLDHFQPESPVTLVGHSMGANIASMYAGMRPSRVARVVNLEGFGLSPGKPEDAPHRYAKWIGQIARGARFRDYASFEELADRLRANNSRLTPERAHFLSRHWGRAGPGGRVELASDPAHKLINPIPYRIDETLACWRQVSAPVMWVIGADTDMSRRIKLTDADLAFRKSCFKNLHECVIPGAAHMLHHDQPELLAEAIEDFLARTG